MSERLVFLTNKPARHRSMFTLIHPLEAEVWAAVVFSLFFVSGSLYFITRREGRLISLALKNWDSLKNSTWYAFGTLIGESITRDTKSEGAWSLR